MTDRGEARSKLLSRTSALEPFDCGEGVVVYLKKPTVAQRQRLLKAAGVKGGSTEDLDQSKFQVAIALELVVDKDGNRIFERADEDALSKVEAGDWLDKLSRRAQSLLTGAEVEQGKPSDETASAS